MRLREAYVYDAAQFGPHWRAWLGVRRSQLDRSSALSDGSEAVSLSQSFTTPWGALGWQSAGTFVYGSAGSGVEIETVPNRPDVFSNPGAVLPALRSQQAEFGIKQSYGCGGLATLALFQIEKPSADDVPQDGGLVERVSDLKEQRHRGIEASYAGRIGPNVGVSASAGLDRRRDHEVGGSGAHRQAADQCRAVRRGAAHGLAPAHEPRASRCATTSATPGARRSRATTASSCRRTGNGMQD